MTKRDLVKAISEELGVPLAKTQEIVQRTLEGIVATLVKEGRIELRDFGVFQVKERRSRMARNPRTGEKVSVPKRVVVSFKPGREMQERIGKLQDVPNKP